MRCQHGNDDVGATSHRSKWPNRETVAGAKCSNDFPPTVRQGCQNISPWGDIWA